MVPPVNSSYKRSICIVKTGAERGEKKKLEEEEGRRRRRRELQSLARWQTPHVILTSCTSRLD